MHACIEIVSAFIEQDLQLLRGENGSETRIPRKRFTGIIGKIQEFNKERESNQS